MDKSYSNDKELKKIIGIVENYEGRKTSRDLISDIDTYNKLLTTELKITCNKDIRLKNLTKENKEKIERKVTKKIKNLEKKYHNEKISALYQIKKRLKEGENPQEISFELETAFKIAKEINNNFYNGKKVVNPYGVFFDIQNAKAYGDIGGGYLCHSIAQRKKNGNVGGIEVPAELIYKKMEDVLSRLFGENARIEKAKNKGEVVLENFSKLARDCWDQNLKETIYRKIFPKTNNFSTENYNNPQIKKEIFDEIKGLFLDELNTDDMRFLQEGYEEYLRNQLKKIKIEFDESKRPRIYYVYCQKVNEILEKRIKNKKVA